ncbi:unnamed protein product [Amoebophrya sp. A25]|nr:unnamed protein product [Amoebophrya sp. A25]|eukprot:GSA25T00025227001.1
MSGLPKLVRAGGLVLVVTGAIIFGPLGVGALEGKKKMVTILPKLVRAGGLLATGANLFCPVGGDNLRGSKILEQFEQEEQQIQHFGASNTTADTNGVTAFDDDDLHNEAEPPRSSALEVMKLSGTRMAQVFWDGIGSAYDFLESGANTVTSWNNAGSGDNNNSNNNNKNNFISVSDQDETSSNYKTLGSSTSTAHTAHTVLTENNSTSASSSALETQTPYLKKAFNYAIGNNLDPVVGDFLSDSSIILTETALSEDLFLREHFIRTVLFGGKLDPPPKSEPELEGFDPMTLHSYDTRLQVPQTAYTVNEKKLQEYYRKRKMSNPFGEPITTKKKQMISFGTKKLYSYASVSHIINEIFLRNKGTGHDHEGEDRKWIRRRLFYDGTTDQILAILVFHPLGLGAAAAAAGGDRACPDDAIKMNSLKWKDCVRKRIEERVKMRETKRENLMNPNNGAQLQEDKYKYQGYLVDDFNTFSQEFLENVFFSLVLNGVVELGDRSWTNHWVIGAFHTGSQP